MAFLLLWRNSKPFTYNNLDQFLDIINSNSDIAAVKMEVQRSNPPEVNFLEEIRRVCTKNGIVLFLMNVLLGSVKPLVDFT